MCGIIGYIGDKQVVPILIDGLRRLEYRGYDSAGVAVVRDGAIELRRSAGKLARLEEAIAVNPLDGEYGIGHTRWATHGRPTEENAHPHRDCTGRIVVVHNGIIENYLDLKRQLQKEGHVFVTETDTEIVAHLVEREMKDDGLENAVRRALLYMRGLFALVLISADDPDKIVTVRNGPPIVVGLGDKEFFVASDIPAILAHTRDVVFLGDEEMAVITPAGVEFTDYSGRAVSAQQHARLVGSGHGGEGRLQALHAQGDFRAAVGSEGNRARTGVARDRPGVPAGDRDPRRRRSGRSSASSILACGTSWHSALVGKFLIETLARVPVDVDYGSEYRYRDPIVSPNTLAIVITQSGETADTLAALREAKKKGARSIAICNVVGSMATRETEGTVYTHAGPEIGVASTKAFTSQLVALHLLAMYLGQIRGTLDAEAAQPHLDALTQLPLLLEQTLKVRAADRRDRAAVLPAQRLSLPRARHQLSDRARRRVEAEGNLVHSRRGLSGRRDEARPDRAHRRTHAGRDDRAARSRVREDDRQHPGSQSARRLGDRPDHTRAKRTSRHCSIRRRTS